MAFSITERAVKEAKQVIQEEERDPVTTVLRVAVVGGGCSGFSNKLTLCEESEVTDRDDRYEFHGLKVVIDRKSTLYLSETTVDFYDGLEKRGFLFDNKLATGRCGCGSSFSMS